MRSPDWFAERFGLDPPVIVEGPADRGYQGQVWRLTSGPAVFAVKETFSPIDHDQVALAYAFQTKAASLGVDAPRQLCTVEGEPAAYAEHETLRLYDWVELAAPDRGLDPVAVGRMLATLHRSAPGSDGDVDGWYVDPVGRDRWIELVAELRLTGAPFAAGLAALLPELVTAESIMEPPRDVIICHRDLWADNVRAAPDGRPVVIDWDNCGPASASGELAMVLTEFGTTRQRASELYAAYCTAGGPARISRLADFTMPIAVLHHLVELGARQWLTAAGVLARQRAADRVLEFTGDPFLVRDAEGLLAATRSD